MLEKPSPSSSSAQLDLPSGGLATVDGSLTAGDAAFAVIGAHFGAMVRREPGVRERNDAEDLHQMRVAIRRVRAAMLVFQDSLPARAPRLQRELGWLGSLLGAVRDLDVQLEQIGVWSAAAEQAERDALDVVGAVLDQHRDEARARLLAAMESQRFARLTHSMERFLLRGPVKRSVAARVSILEAAPEAIGRGYRKLIAIGDHISEGSPAHALHALRIRCKRLRYTVEFVEPIYGKPARAYVKRMVALQDVLGAHQDAVVARASLRAVALDPSHPLDPGTIFALGALADRHRTSALGSRVRLAKRYRDVTGPRWRRLGRALEDVRPPKPERSATAPQPGAETVMKETG
jgi:triphosphatase